jgi:hypothetical protein
MAAILLRYSECKKRVWGIIVIKRYHPTKIIDIIFNRRMNELPLASGNAGFYVSGKEQG